MVGAQTSDSLFVDEGLFAPGIAMAPHLPPLPPLCMLWWRRAGCLWAWHLAASDFGGGGGAEGGAGRENIQRIRFQIGYWQSCAASLRTPQLWLRW